MHRYALPLWIFLLPAALPGIGLNYTDERQPAIDRLNGLGDPYVMTGFDPRGRAGIEPGVYGVPETFIIDRRGKVIYK